MVEADVLWLLSNSLAIIVNVQPIHPQSLSSRDTPSVLINGQKLVLQKEGTVAFYGYWSTIKSSLPKIGDIMHFTEKLVTSWNSVVHIYLSGDRVCLEPEVSHTTKQSVSQPFDRTAGDRRNHLPTIDMNSIHWTTRYWTKAFIGAKLQGMRVA